MPTTSRWPLAVTCLGLGAAVATLATAPLHGQPAAPDAAGRVAAGVSYRDVVKAVLPAVVSVEPRATRADRRADGRPRPQLPPGLPEEFRRFFEAPEFGFGGDDGDDGAPRRRGPTAIGFGSGVLVAADGVVLTNNHVVDRADEVVVSLQDGRTFVSKDIRKDPKTDLAVVKLPGAADLPFLAFGDSDAVQVGDQVLAVGAPFGLTGSVTQGIVSAKSRQNLRLNQYEDFLQTDAAINPGNSGGPLVDLAGKVVGLNSAIKTRTGGFQGVGLAISSNLAKDIVAQLLRDGVVRRGYLGVAVSAIDGDLARRLGVPEGDGVIVAQVFPDSPAAKGGLKVGDVVTAVNGTAIRGLNTLPRVVSRLPIGKPTEVGYVRDGQAGTLTLTVEEQPEDYGRRAARDDDESPRRSPRGTAVDRYGLTVSELTPDVAGRLGYPRDARGVVVTAVTAAGPAADAGLRVGSVVSKVDRTPVATAREFADAVAAADPDKGALLQVVSPTGEVDFLVLKAK